MSQMAQQPIMKMEISDIFVYAQHLVGGGEVMISLIELGPSGGLVVAGVYHYDECCKWRVEEEINNVFGAFYPILDVEMELLQVL
jgi:hypothetical protein